MFCGYKKKIYICTTKTIKEMNASTITKVLNKSKENEIIYTLGFRRLLALPVLVRKNVSLECILRGEHNQESIKAIFNNMTEQEFINWLKLR